MSTSKNTVVHRPEAHIKREIILDSFELNVTDAAHAIGASKLAFSALLIGRADRAFEMTLRIEKAFGVETDKLSHLQTNWSIAEQRKAAEEVQVLACRPT
ncbi:MAG: addiction module antidote protein, HigA family [Devosia sp.]